MKYLKVYRNISKSRGQAPQEALATAFVNFGKDQNGLILPIFHNGGVRIRVQPTSIPSRKTKIKASTAQATGPKPSFKGIKGEESNEKHQLKLGKTASNIKHQRSPAKNVKLNLPNAGHTRKFTTYSNQGLIFVHHFCLRHHVVFAINVM